MRPLLTLKGGRLLLLLLSSYFEGVSHRPPREFMALILFSYVVSVCWLTGKPGADKKSDNQKRPLLSAQQKKIDGRVESFSDRREEVCLSLLECIQQEIWFFKDFFSLQQKRIFLSDWFFLLLKHFNDPKGILDFFFYAFMLWMVTVKLWNFPENYVLHTEAKCPKWFFLAWKFKF